MSDTEASERIAKYLARAGVASRREVERLIEAGRVKVNGKTLDTPATKVSSSDTIEVDGKRVEPPAATRLWRYHKPAGLVTTHADPEGRETVFDAIPKEIGRVISVGRLDLTSEGLLLLTNDGALARALELPSTAWMRRYRARAFGSIDEAAVAKLRAGVTVEGIKYGPMEVEIERETGSNIWLDIGIREGKNREVRKALDSVGLKVNRLIRTAYGPFHLGDLARGEIKAVPGRVLRDQAGHLVEMAATTGEAVAKKRPQRPGKRPVGRKMGGPGQPGLPKEAGDEDGAKPLKRARGRPNAPRSTRSDALSRTGGPARTERGNRTGGPARGESAGRSERPNRGERPDRPSRSGEGPRSDRPARGDGPNRGGPSRGGPGGGTSRGGPGRDGPNREGSNRGGPNRGGPNRSGSSGSNRPSGGPGRPGGDRPRGGPGKPRGGR